LTRDNKVFGCGRKNRGQLGVKFSNNDKVELNPIEIKLEGEVMEVFGGSVYSMAMVQRKKN
jgi:alpha-tubulin suppressor-like RCC1 family protein